MGLFDKSKGGSAVAEPQTGGPLLENLKTRYQSVLNLMHEQGVRLQNLHVQEGKLYLRAEAPSVVVKNRLWDEIKLVNPAADDLIADITVNPSNPTPSAGAAEEGAARTYTVKPGDTLSKIAQEFYGKANDYYRIFEANRDTLSDPDQIQPGQKLRIP